jgi:hypothetical protein
VGTGTKEDESTLCQPNFPSLDYTALNDMLKTNMDFDLAKLLNRLKLLRPIKTRKRSYEK